jgi:hypothetical protein
LFILQYQAIYSLKEFYDDYLLSIIKVGDSLKEGGNQTYNNDTIFTGGGCS